MYRTSVTSAVVADRLRELRTQRGWSQQLLAEKCAAAGMPSLSRGKIAKIESGARKSIKLEEVAVLAQALGVPPAALESGSGTGPSAESAAATDHGPLTGSDEQHTRAQARPPAGPDFFISYSPADKHWAAWIAWTLEVAGYTTMLQAWDFVPGMSIADFTDRGVRTASAVIAILSPSYLKSRYGRLEWQAAMVAEPENAADRLITVRVAECRPEGLLSAMTYVDLAGVAEPEQAQALLLARIRHVRPINGRRSAVMTEDDPGGWRSGRRPLGTAPAFPPAAFDDRDRRTAVTLLHIAGPRFGRGPGDADGGTAAELQGRIWADLTRLADEGAPRPDILVVTGDLTESSSIREFTEATEFLSGLRVLLSLEPHRLVVVPGGHDISRKACQAYFTNCEADDIVPTLPYWPKWRHYVRLFEELYQGVDNLVFDPQQPWTLFPMPDLNVVVAGLNSTIHDSHRPEDHYGVLGEAQAAWFAGQLASYEDAGWLRIGAVRHAPTQPDADDRADCATLRDTATLDRLLGSRLNLVLHGPGPAGARLDRRTSGLTAVPLAVPGEHQLVQVSADGLVRWPGSQAAAPDPGGARFKRLAQRWRHTGTTFVEDSAGTDRADAASAMPGLGTGTGPVDTDDPVDPTERLLDRIAEVCETRHDNTRIRRVPGRPPYLAVMYREDGFVPQQWVGAHVGEVTPADLDRFVGQVRALDPDVSSELVYDGPRTRQALRDDAARQGVRLQSFIEFQGLLDLRDFVAGQAARLRNDPTYPPSLYVPQRFRELVGANRAVRSGLVEELMRLLATDDGRFVLVLGDFGQGKTFALREVARRIAVERPHLIPILIELRALDKAHSVAGLVAAHLANHGEELIDLKAFHYMLREGRIVLLFDGFDELAARVTYERATAHLDTLLEALDGKAKIVVSSRTQHFRTNAQVLTALGERVGMMPHRRVLNVESFTPEQIRAYLTNRYGGDEQAAEDRLRLIGGTGDLLGLSHNPRMLSFIADLDDERLRGVAQGQTVVSAARLYDEILNTWLGHEQRRTSAVPGAPAGLTVAELWQAVTLLAVRLWESTEPFLRAAELVEVADTLTAMAHTQLSPQQTAHAVGAGSLLVRTEDGLFGFIHSSVMEWLVAKQIADELVAGAPRPPLLSRRPLSQLATDFVSDLADAAACLEWLRSVLADPTAEDIARVNALKISSRLRTVTHADLRGAALPGEDLSHRELSDADLTGADLTGARLVGANLTRASLRDAHLAGARLDGATLAGADLTGADLSRARLSRVDLRDVVVTGSRWVRAALIDVAARPDLLRAPELRGAAISPGTPVETQLAPATIGVSYGFEVGRLPQPISYSRDGGLLAIGSDDGAVLVCDAEIGRPIRTLHGHRGRVYAVAYGSGDTVLATAGSDGTVNLWAPLTGALLARLTGHRDWVWPMALRPDGGMVAAGDSSGTVRLWDVDGGSLRHELAGHATRVWTAAFSPDGALLATGDSVGGVRLWETATGRLRHELAGHRRDVFRLAFSPDGNLLATAEQTGTVRLFDVGRGVLRHELTGHSRAVYTVDFHPAGELLASGDTAGSVRLWDPRTGQLRAELPKHSGAVYSITFDPAGALLATCDSDGTIRVWEAGSGQPRHTLTGHKSSVWPLVFRPDGRQIASSSNDGTTRLWDAETGQCRHVLRGHGRHVRSVQFNGDGSLLATSGNDGVVRLWQPRTGRLHRELKGIADRLLFGFFNPAWPHLAAASNAGGIYLWNTETGEFERELSVETDHLWAAAFSPDGDVLATANDDDSVRFWYRTTGRQILCLAEHRGRVRSIAFSPDGKIVATGCDDRMVRLWDTGTGACLATLAGHTDRVYTVQFNPAGTTLISASNDGTAILWDTATEQRLHTLGRHTGRLWAAAFNEDGALVATAGDDLVIRVWQAATGRHLHTLTGHTRRVWSVAFSPDGTMLASAGDDGSVHLWGFADPSTGRPEVTLLGLREGSWAALARDGGYKIVGDAAGEFWHAVGMCRFEPGELDEYLPGVLQPPLDAEMVSRAHAGVAVRRTGMSGAAESEEA